VELTPGNGGDAFFGATRSPKAPWYRRSPQWSEMTLRTPGPKVQDHTEDSGQIIDETVRRVVLLFATRDEAITLARSICGKARGATSKA
jgi:hypothetical protein